MNACINVWIVKRKIKIQKEWHTATKPLNNTKRIPGCFPFFVLKIYCKLDSRGGGGEGGCPVASVPRIIMHKSSNNQSLMGKNGGEESSFPPVEQA
jgi:hypothetical protein